MEACVCVSVCGYLNINTVGYEGVWLRVGLLMYVTFLGVSKEKHTRPSESLVSFV